ncbi:hypothetical protein KHA80_09185 [Anaerobacillus sp. HL2]|nr:hypothetical protein KHA80_09185 [Anaerobacillus sp. HL2]
MSGKFFQFILGFYPTFNEHMQSVKYLYENNQLTNEDQVKAIDEDSKGIALLEKYEKVEILFDNYEFDIDIEELTPSSIPLNHVINQVLIDIYGRQDLFNLNPNAVHKTGAVYLPKVSILEGDFNSFIESIKSKK